MNIPASFKDSTSEGFFPLFARAVAPYLEEITLIPSKHLMVPAIDQSRDVTPAKNKNNTNRPSVGEECQALPPSACETPPLGHISIPLMSIVIIGGHKS